MDNQPHYYKDDSIVTRTIAGETILVPVRQNVGDMESIYTLNESASRAWELIGRGLSLDEICDRLVDEFDVDREIAWLDLQALVTQLLEIGAIREAV